MRVIRCRQSSTFLRALTAKPEIEDKKPRADSAARVRSIVPRVEREPFMANSMTFDL
jgi:hypothetical protein